MVHLSLCDPYVWEDPKYLFRTVWTNDRTRQQGTCASELVNHIIFIYAISILLGLLVSPLTQFKGGLMIFGLLATTYLIPTFMKLRDIESFRTQFENSNENGHDTQDTSGSKIEKFVDKGNVGETPNPFNNVLVNEIYDSPTRPSAPDITSVQAKNTLDEFFRIQWHSDPTDVFGKSQSQRQFITQPSTSIPNDQGSYQDWLYKIPGKTCKEGNGEACYGGTNGAPLPSLNL